MADPTMRERVARAMQGAQHKTWAEVVDVVLAELEHPTEGMIAAALPIIQPHPSQNDLDIAGRALSLLDPAHKVTGRNAAAGLSAALHVIIDFRAAIRAARDGK